MRRELQAFFTALMFYTRIPCPSWVDHSEEYLRISRKYFPLIGWIIGGSSALILLLLYPLLPITIVLFLSIAVSIILTGAFHEDGFADTMDGFGGGWTKEKILAIMKDSRLGTFGAIGLMLILAIKFLAILELVKNIQESSYSFEFQQRILACFVSGHSVSRFVALTFFKTHQYAKLNDTIGSKSKPIAKGDFPTLDLFVASVFGFLPMALFQHYAVFLAIIPCFIAKWWMGRWFNKWIGGYTGDCLGAVQQVTEVIFYLSLLIIWKFA
ncbi:adenosylcobinamide-GDP ribazoletransferase [Echinicola vietnamensis]|uniref:Adenosylcobinamide-GDP ribazoletransferase n=1 Tax=Echinicola vietnamensis (strain DSM 17526 / LMG 23754 / KMM 6221) TaxID=926556 RepID=L0G371_ECHVK|nr:adenosylcobinamide-GDP ribazoletransferase [Echinicola vietnamensis]AGA79972.1 cobalamin-5-phosphate synthase [Echinicola vietnamensis DSM 17526]